MGAQSNAAPIIIKKKRVVAGDGHHGGAWKVAYADFVTAMMAFFMLMWLLNATTEKQRKGLADYFESCVALFPHPKTVSNWVTGELLRELKASQTSPEDSAVSPARMIELLQLVDSGTVSLKAAREVFSDFYSIDITAEQLVKDKGLVQVSDEGQLTTIIREVLAGHTAQVEQYRSGKEAVLGFFVGQVMKASKGKANPGKVNELLKRELTA